MGAYFATKFESVVLKHLHCGHFTQPDGSLHLLLRVSPFQKKSGGSQRFTKEKKINHSESSESISFYLTLMLLSDGETTLNCCFEHEVFSTLICSRLV